MPLITEVLDDANLLEETVWSFLARACNDVRHAFRLCMLATVNEQHLPKNRVVVLRSCDTQQKLLSFHTDIRSGKIEQLKQNPAVSMLFWDNRHSLQVRIEGSAIIHHQDSTAFAKISILPPNQIALYGHATPPGTVMEKSKEENFREALVAINFAWVSIQALQMEILHLGRTGTHTRCISKYSPENKVSAFFIKA